LLFTLLVLLFFSSAALSAQSAMIDFGILKKRQSAIGTPSAKPQWGIITT